MSYGLDFFVLKNEFPTHRAAIIKELRGGKALSEVSHSLFARSKAYVTIFKRELRNKSGTLFLLAVWPGHGNGVLRRRGGKIYPHGDMPVVAQCRKTCGVTRSFRILETLMEGSIDEKVVALTFNSNGVSIL